MNDFINGVHSNPLVRICPSALSSNHGLGKVGGVDAT